MTIRKGPSLPQSLLDEIVASDHPKREKSAHHLSRRDARKQERNVRKQRKTEFFSHRPHKRSTEQEHEDSPRRKKQKLEDNSMADASVMNHAKGSKPISLKDTANHTKKPKRTALEKLGDRQTSRGTVPLRSRAEDEEDSYIAYLESKLGWSKGGYRAKSYGKGLKDDGLDELLKDLDGIETSTFSVDKPDARFEDEQLDSNADTLSETEDEESQTDQSEGENMLADGPGLSGEFSDDEEEWNGIFETEATQSSDNSPGHNAFPQASASAPVGRYIPPHLRNRTVEQSEEQIKLTRQLKGLLNRLSEQNISSIIDGVEEMYTSNRRNDVTSTIATLIIDGISSHSILLDTYVVLHAAFVSALHKVIGIEFAAHFIQNVVASYEHHFKTLAVQKSEQGRVDQKDDEAAGKECSNLIVLLSELYNFQVISCVLVYDIIRSLLEGSLWEFKVELLLKVTKNSGSQLRSDDPSALKDIIQIVHAKVPQEKEVLSSRTRFMIETLTNLKNNKMKKNSTPSAAADAVDRMKKFLSALGKKCHVMAHEPLRVSLADLHNADTKGKWWLVGAAWGGDPLVEHQQELKNTEVSGSSGIDEDTLVKLARKQGMNTAIRKGIFTVLMTAEDYMDACERLTQLRLTEVQQREVIRVLLHCCGNEKSYNPYYSLIAQQLCRTSHSPRFTLQYCLWDFLRDLGEENMGGAEVIKNLKENSTPFEVKKISLRRSKNVARAYGWWVAKDCCDLTILKPMDFTIIKSQTREFLLELFANIFTCTQLSAPRPISADEVLDTTTATKNRSAIEEVFIKATRIPALALGLVFFLAETAKEHESEFSSWANRVALDTLKAGMDIVPNL